MENEDDGSTLQNDLDILSVWETRWDMEFNPSMCQVVHVTGSKRPVKRDYILHDQVLEYVTCTKYLGVDISGSLSWNSHIDRITGTTNRTLAFLWRNIKTKMSKVYETAYNTLVRPQLEYASAVWDPHNNGADLPNRASPTKSAHWTVSNFDRRASVTKIVQDLGWHTLDQRMADSLQYCTWTPQDTVCYGPRCPVTVLAVRYWRSDKISRVFFLFILFL